MQITVFGATGATGRLLVQQALDEGADVVVYSRHPDRLQLTNDKLRVVEGDLSDAGAIERAVEGSDGVVSLLRQGVPVKGKPIAAGTHNILNAMQKAGVHRIVAVATASAADPADKPPLRSKAAIGFARLFMRPAYDDVVATAQEIRKSDRDWTIVRPPLLRDGRKTGQVVAGYLGDGVTGNYLSRANAADFMLKQLHGDTYLRKAPIVADA
ncbi:putative NADH-flavin reductase [Pseudarthrobacter defluvii]|uniref:NAD(P)-dependent oxidoreductase n=1 Tax=Pseudarthrobacter defluvii TaxID=410837 RepID=UPI0027844B5D|nr:NAD(P)H-binding protein [Pseudarthrobacter defluvii]MDQ0770965.1 putative NADH-flavin reductase [Pseudarthrobacter defluvii]